VRPIATAAAGVTVMVASLLVGAIAAVALWGPDSRRCERDRMALAKATDDKIMLCNSARVLTVTILYSLRSPETADSGISEAQQLGLLMRYCDGDRGAALARDIEDAVMESLPRERGETPPPVDIERIRAALLAFKNDGAP
jgi:hypothetical protein